MSALQNEKSLTSLYRAPKIQLGPLNIRTIADDYQRVLGLDAQRGLELARMTKGYSFAVQVVGYFTWENADSPEDGLRLARRYLDDYAYDKVWSELSRKDQEVLCGVAQVKLGRISEIRELLGLNTNEFNPYRQRLIRKGVISSEERGYVRLLLPFFDQYILAHCDLM